MCHNESCFSDCWKVSLVVLVFKNVGVRSMVKNYCPISLLDVVSTIFEQFVNNKLLDHLEKYFEYCFKSSRSTIDFLTVVSDKLLWLFISLGLLKLEHLLYPRLSTGFAC